MVDEADLRCLFQLETAIYQTTVHYVVADVRPNEVSVVSCTTNLATTARAILSLLSITSPHDDPLPAGAKVKNAAENRIYKDLLRNGLCSRPGLS